MITDAVVLSDSPLALPLGFIGSVLRAFSFSEGDNEEVSEGAVTLNAGRSGFTGDSELVSDPLEGLSEPPFCP